MPLYSDGNFYYSGGSSQLYSPYYTPGLYGSPMTAQPSSTSYQPYSSTYNRTFGGSYVLPLSTPRTSSSYGSSHHGLSSSRYQPKLSTITETGSGRHGGLMPLTRIQSPKFTSYTPTAKASLLPKYVPPRPILINTADIDVSSSKYRKQHEEERLERERKHRQAEEEAAAEEEERRNQASRSANKLTVESAMPDHHSRSTIKRDRAVVRLSTIRSKDRRDRGTPKKEPEPAADSLAKKYSPTSENISWRQKLAEDLAAVPTYPLKKSPGELLRERYLIQDEKSTDEEENELRRKRFRENTEPADKVMIELDPVDHSIRRLSIPQCPTFHDICEDISSDKIDDDLNAGELRRRASVIIEQEQELLNQLQKSASGTFQLINLERRDSVDSFTGDQPVAEQRKSKRGSKRGSKKTKKLRHKITAIVEVENHPHPSLMPILQETEETSTPANKDLSPKPKFTFNVESVEEHHEIHEVFKLPKKKTPPKEAELPEGFVQAVPKAKDASPKMTKNKKRETKPEIFTFDAKSIDKMTGEKVDTPTEKAKIDTPKDDVKPVQEPVAEEPKPKTSPPKPPKLGDLSKSSAISQPSPATPQAETVVQTKPEFPKPKEALKSKFPTLKTSTSLDSSPAAKKVSAEKIEKSQSLTNVEVKSPVKSKLAVTAKTPPIPEEVKELKRPIDTVDAKVKVDSTKVPELETKPKDSPKSKPGTPKLEPTTAKIETKPKDSPKSKPGTPKPDRKANDLKSTEAKPKPTTASSTALKSSVSLDGAEAAVKPKISPKLQKKAQSMDANDPKVATPKPIVKPLQKSQSGEDFWSQIGSRETLYMANRKKPLFDYQQSTVYESQETLPTEEVKPEETMAKTKPEAKTAKTETKTNETPKLAEVKKASLEEAKKKSSPKAKAEDKAKPAVDAKKPVESSKMAAAKDKSNESDQAKATTTPVAAVATTTKINTGHEAKSPEQHKPLGEVATGDKTKTTTTTTTTKTIGKTEDSAADGQAKKKPEISSATAAASTAAIDKQPNRGQMVTSDAGLSKPTSTLSPTKTAAPAGKTPTAAVVSPARATPPPPKDAATPSTSAANKQSPSTINADHFITATVPPVVASTASPTNTKAAKAKKANASPTLTAAKRANEPEKGTTTTTMATTTTTIAKTTTSPAATATTAATTATATPTATQTKTAAAPDQQRRVEEPQPTAEDRSGDNRGDDTLPGAEKNLSKFATVSNLAQCLQDVDAELDDFIPSSAENSDFSDVSTDEEDERLYSSGNYSESMKKKLKLRRKQEKREARAKAAADENRFDPQKKVKIDITNKCYVKDEAPRYPLVATPRPLWKREKIVYSNDDSDESADSDESEGESGSTEETDESEECTTSEEYEDEGAASGAASTNAASKENSAIIRMSTCSNDSGFEGGTAPSSPKKMLECDVNCHKKCERLTANLCGVNQKLIVEALAHVKRGARGEARDSPSTPPSQNPAYKIEAHDEHDETSYTYSQFQKSGRFTAPATVIPRFKNYCVDDFHFLAVLGKGSFGKVLLAELRDTTYYYAVKCLKKDVVLEDDDVDSTLIERKVLALGTKHPYLCHLFCTFQTESHLFFVMEYLNGGDLMFHIQESGRFSEERARFYGAEIISGLKFLHKKGIIYRDLKLDNVLLDYEGHVRIADFGMCKLQIYLDKTADSFCGTPDYMAPEIIKGEKYNQNVDWWSFGVLLYEMLIGQSPFSGCDEDELFWSICNEIPWFPVYISAEATSILKGLLEKDYTKRIGSQYSPAGDISEHIFFRPIDWNLLDKRQLEPPFKPQVKHPLDTQYFDRVFTRERVRLTPIDKEILQSMDQKQFHGFTYTNPHITLD